MKKILCLICLFLCASIVPIHAEESEIRSIDIQCQIDDAGTGHIVEVWDLSAYDGTEVYKTFSNMNDQSIVLESVKEGNTNYKKVSTWDSDLSREEKKNKCGLTKDDDTYEICFGIGKYGKKTYTITYQIKKLVNQYSETQGINFAFMGDMDITPDKVTVDISSSKGAFNTDNSDIWGFGYEGRCDYLDNGHIRMTTNGDINRVQLLAKISGQYSNPSTYHKDETFESVKEDALEGADFDEESDQNVIYDENGEYYDEDEYESDYDADSYFVTLVAVFIAVVWAIIGAVFAMASKDSKKEIIFEDGSKFNKENISPFRDLPTKDLLYFYYLAYKAGIINNENRGNLMSAYILKWIRDHQIQFEKGEKTGLIIKKDNYEIDFTKDLNPNVGEIEERLYDMFIEASGSNRILETKEFERWSSRNYDEIHDFFKRAIKVVDKQLSKKGLYRKETSYNKRFGLDLSTDKETYSLKVKQDMEYVYGLYKFLLDEDNMKDKRVIEVHLWEEYLMFATILGIADKVEKQLKMIHPYFEQQIHYNYYDTMFITRAFVYHSMSAANSAYQSAHSTNSGGGFSGGGGGSSFGGGGGGFSGGGGGGFR